MLASMFSFTKEGSETTFNIYNKILTKYIHNVFVLSQRPFYYVSFLFKCSFLLQNLHRRILHCIYRTLYFFWKSPRENTNKRVPKFNSSYLIEERQRILEDICLKREWTKILSFYLIVVHCCDSKI